MVTHYQGPRSRGWVVSGHLCNLWAYIGAHSPVGLLPTCQLRSLRMKVAVVSSLDPTQSGPTACSLLAACPSCKAQQRQLPSHLVPTSLLLQPKGFLSPVVVQLWQGQPWAPSRPRF